MKAQELRIGNYVKMDRDYTINEYDIPYAFKFEPIPLTEEWLTKFGFEFDNHYPTKDEGNYSLNPDDFYTIEACREDKNDILKYYAYCGGSEYKMHEIKHVHQLQNLFFALTGEELTTKK